MQYIHLRHRPLTMRFDTHVRINEHDSLEETSSYTDQLSDTALPKEASSPATGNAESQKVKSEPKEIGKA